jgi:pilus assembly protein CpaB
MPNRRGLAFLALAIVLGLGAALMARQLTGATPSAATAAVETRPVVVARVDVATATGLAAPDLELVDWPAAYVPQGAIHTLPAAEGRVTRRPIVAGEPVLEGALFERGAEGDRQRPPRRLGQGGLGDRRRGVRQARLACGRNGDRAPRRHR